MSYTIKVEISQSVSNFYKVVEQTVYNQGEGGTWDRLLLTLDSSNTSGGLRLMSTGEERNFVFVVLGVHNHSPWCDVVQNLKPRETAMEVHPTYHNGGSRCGIVLSTFIRKTNYKGLTVTVEIEKEEEKKR